MLLVSDQQDQYLTSHLPAPRRRNRLRGGGLDSGFRSERPHGGSGRFTQVNPPCDCSSANGKSGVLRDPILGELSVPETAPGLKALIEETPAMLWRGDQRGRCVFLNKAQRDFWGVEDPVLDEFDWSSTLVPEDQEKVFGPFREGMELRQPFTCEARYRRADGTVRVLRTKAAPYFAPDGAFLGMVGVNEDVSDLREAQASLDARNQELESSLHQASAATSRFELATRISGLSMSERDEKLRYTWDITSRRTASARRRRKS